MKSEPTSPTANVRHSSFLSFWAAVALGSAVSVGLGVYLLNGPIFRLVGRQTPGAYLLALLFFVPIVLTLAERAAVYPGSGGLFNLAKRSQNIFISFTAGWLLLGGTLFLGAILAWGAGQYLQVGLANYFDLDLNPTAIGLTLVLLVTLSQLYGSTADWRNRTIFIFGAILL
ncbi:MAG: amino acid permease, partial [Chloroflexi bacterium]|nr:amino acid permease [Chloroflexota bacterium]